MIPDNLTQDAPALQNPDQNSAAVAEQKAHDMMEIALAFIQLMATEIELLKLRKISELSALQPEKVALSDLYRAHMNEVVATPGFFGEIDPAVRGELKRLATQLEATARENEHRVRSALELNTKLMDRIAAIAQQNRPMASGYTNTGARQTSSPHRGYAQAPVTLNQQF
ncbi:MAG: hypothetical protein ACJAU6_000920 [Alphaproteobacteria bacterium]|jgi:hypothetical protein